MIQTLPYWGEGKDRASLRSYWNLKIAYTKDTPYHVVVTSYAVAVQDIEYLKKQKWQYMILDEAHAIKSSSRYFFFLRSFGGSEKSVI